jgi:PAS domain-containing protein
MGLVITCLTMFGPPAVYAAWTLWGLEQRALQYATVGARHLEAQLSLQLSADSLGQAASTVLQATSIASGTVVATWVTNRDGKVMYFQGGQANWQERTVSAPIHAFRFEGRLFVALSTREVIVNTCGVLAAFLLLGLLANYYFRRLPLLALDEALRQLNAKQEELLLQKAELESQNERFDAALNNMSQGLCLYDREQKLVVCNASYVTMYGLAPELTVPGTPLAKILEHRIRRGIHAGEIPEEDLSEMLNLGQPRKTGHQDLGTQRPARHCHQASADAAGRLALLTRGHHRISADRGAHRPYGASRCPNGAAQSPVAAPTPGARRAGTAAGKGARRAVPRSRSLQADQ